MIGKLLFGLLFIVYYAAELSILSRIYNVVFHGLNPLFAIFQLVGIIICGIIAVGLADYSVKKIEKFYKQ